MNEQLLIELNQRLAKFETLISGKPVNKTDGREAERKRLYERMDKLKLKKHLKSF